MGCGIHSVLQKRVNGSWHTIDVDVLQLGSSMARAFNGATEPYRITARYDELESEFNVPRHFMGEEHYMGEHSLGVISLQDFCNIDTGTYSSRVSFEHDEYGGIDVHIEPQFCMDDIEGVIKTLQSAYQHMYYELDNYRLIIGYDS